jgi:hypothetical protein
MKNSGKNELLIALGVAMGRAISKYVPQIAPPNRLR